MHNPWPLLQQPTHPEAGLDSGTVAAAKQWVLLGVQAVAFSQVINGEEPTYEKQKPYIAEMAWFP